MHRDLSVRSPCSHCSGGYTEDFSRFRHFHVFAELGHNAPPLSIGFRRGPQVYQTLQWNVSNAVVANPSDKLPKNVARELRYVKPERQVEILELMESCNDFSVPFVRGLILKTHVSKRAKLPANGFSPWEKSEKKNDDLLKRLQEVEEKQEFYAGLYRQYSYNLLKLIIYVRSLMANERVHAKLVEQHAGLLDGFREIVEGSEG